MADKLLEIKDLEVLYKSGKNPVHAVNGISLTLNKGETLGLVGETGAGKTTTALAILRLLPERTGCINQGQILFEGRDLLTLSEEEMRTQIRGEKISMIFQDPMTSLNPVATVGDQIAEAIIYHSNGQKVSQEQIDQRVGEVLEMVGIPAARKNEYPHQFSGGMKQRVVIAMALSCQPDLLIADEPTTALDVTIQAQVLSMMSDLRDKLGTAMIMITHDLGMQAEIVLKPEQEPDARKVLEDLLAALREEYANTDPELSLTLEPLGHEADQAMDEASGRRCAELMYLLPYGVMKYDSCDRDVILNSVNTVRVTCENGVVEYEQMIRSPIDAYKWELVDRLRILAELTGASLVVQDSYAGWPFRKDSPLQQLCCQVYNRLTGQELKIEKLNSCAETGEIAGAIPDMDIVALAPWGRGAHTPREHLDLDTLQPFWEFLTALLRAMCEEA